MRRTWFPEFIYSLIRAICVFILFFFCYSEPIFQHFFYRAQRPLFISDGNLFASIFMQIIFFYIYFFFSFIFFFGIIFFFISSFRKTEIKFFKIIFFTFVYTQFIAFFINEFDISFINSFNNVSNNNIYSWWNLFERTDSLALREQYFGFFKDIFFYFICFYLRVFCILQFPYNLINYFFIELNSKNKIYFYRKFIKHYSEDTFSYKFYKNITRFCKKVLFIFVFRIFKLLILFYFIGGEGFFSDICVVIASFFFIEGCIYIFRFLIYLQAFKVNEIKKNCIIV